MRKHFCSDGVQDESRCFEQPCAPPSPHSHPWRLNLQVLVELSSCFIRQVGATQTVRPVWHLELYLKSLFQSCRQAGALQGTFPKSFSFILHIHLVKKKKKKSPDKEFGKGRLISSVELFFSFKQTDLIDSFHFNRLEGSYQCKGAT